MGVRLGKANMIKVAKAFAVFAVALSTIGFLGGFTVQSGMLSATHRQSEPAKGDPPFRNRCEGRGEVR